MELYNTEDIKKAKELYEKSLNGVYTIELYDKASESLNSVHICQNENQAEEMIMAGKDLPELTEGNSYRVFKTKYDSNAEIIEHSLIKEYTRADIEADSKLNDKIQVDDPVSDIDNDETLNADDYNALRTVNIKSTADNRKGQQETIYSANTEIPVMRTDFYGTSIKNIKILDVDFFNTNSSNSNDGWKVIRAFVSGASHIVMYVAAALLLTMIIWRSILFVRSSFADNPEGAYESRQVMDNFIRAVLLLGCVYLIMTFLYYFYKQMVNILTNGNNSVYLLRLNVEGVYAFNTNVMGYLKYMTMNSNTLAALGASICYAVASIFNLLWFGVMFVRMILIGGLIVIAPLTAVYAMMGRTPSEGVHTGNILNLSNFMTFYSVLLFLPFVVAGIQKIIMLIA